MPNVQDFIQEMVQKDRVFLFMKGNRFFPQCGFSARAVQVLQRLNVPFATFDVLSDPDVREGVKAFSKWPTIPQLYVDGQFIGGSDIMMEMFESGELQELLNKPKAEPQT